MEETVRRPGHARYSSQTRYARTGNRSRNIVKRPVLRNFILCFIIVGVIRLVTNINTPQTQKFINYIKTVLQANITLNGVYSTIDDIVVGFKKINIPWSKKGNRSDEPGDGIEDVYTLGASTHGDKLAPPLKGKIVSDYGERIDPIGAISEFHSGIDIEPMESTEIRAIMDGDVIDVGNSKNYGKYISIKNSNGYIVTYAHCSAIYVFSSANIKQGDVIGDVNRQVEGVGTHLHLEIQKDGQFIDPKELLAF